MLLNFGKDFSRGVTFISLAVIAILSFAEEEVRPESYVANYMTGSGSMEERRRASELISFIYRAAKDPSVVGYQTVNALSGEKLILTGCQLVKENFRRCSYSLRSWDPGESNINYFYSYTKRDESDSGISLGMELDTRSICLNPAVLIKLWGVEPQKIDLPMQDFFGPEEDKRPMNWSAEIYKNSAKMKSHVALKTYSKNQCVSQLMLDAHQP